MCYYSVHCILCTALSAGQSIDQEVQVMFDCNVCQKKDLYISQLEDKLQAHLGEWLYVHTLNTYII